MSEKESFPRLVHKAHQCRVRAADGAPMSRSCRLQGRHGPPRVGGVLLCVVLRSTVGEASLAGFIESI